jgi:hypothetical protein
MLACLVTAVLLELNHFHGYAAVAIAVGLAAGTNLL